MKDSQFSLWVCPLLGYYLPENDSALMSIWAAQIKFNELLKILKEHTKFRGGGKQRVDVAEVKVKSKGWISSKIHNKNLKINKEKHIIWERERRLERFLPPSFNHTYMKSYEHTERWWRLQSKEKDHRMNVSFSKMILDFLSSGSMKIIFYVHTISCYSTRGD